MDPPIPPPTPGRENSLQLCAAVVAISISVVLFIFLFDKFILSKLMAAAVAPRSKSHEIEQLMPPVMIRISDKSSGITSTNGGGSNQCVICLEEFKDGDLCRVFPHCNHEFHVPCIDAWLEGPNLTCPVCRKSLEDLV